MGKGPSPQTQQRCANEGHDASWSQLKCGFEIVAGQPRGCDWQYTKRENQSQSVEQERPLISIPSEFPMKRISPFETRK